MTELAQAVLIAISLSPAPPTADQVAERVCQPRCVVVDVMAELKTDGLVDPWLRPDGLVYVLTPLACERLEVRITDLGGYIAQRGRGGPAPKSLKISADKWINDLVDPTPGPDELAELAEEAESAGRPTRDGPRPSILVGEGLCPFPGQYWWWDDTVAVTGVPLPCPACKAAPLAPSAYCLVCDRWGMDRPHGVGRRRRRPCPNEGTIRPKLRAGREAALKRRGKRCPHG